MRRAVRARRTPFRRRGLPAPYLAEADQVEGRKPRLLLRHRRLSRLRRRGATRLRPRSSVLVSGRYGAPVRRTRGSGTPVRPASATPTPTWDGRSGVVCTARRRCTGPCRRVPTMATRPAHRFALRSAHLSIEECRRARARAGRGLQHDVVAPVGRLGRRVRTRCRGTRRRTGHCRRAADAGVPMGSQPWDALDQVAAGPSAAYHGGPGCGWGSPSSSIWSWV